MKKIKSFIHLIRNILLETFTGIICAVIPAIVMYAVNQTSLSRIKQYGAESEQGIEAMNISKWTNIICIIIFVIIALYVLIQIIRILKKEIDPVKEYDNLPITSVDCGEYKSNDDMKVEENIWGEKFYTKDGKVVAKVEKDFFGDEVIKDSSNNVIGKGTYNSLSGKTTYQNNNYQEIAEKETNIFGNSKIKTKDGKTFEEENNILGSTLKKK